MDMIQLEVFEWKGESERDFAALAQDHFAGTRVIVDKVARDSDTFFYAYSAEQVDSLANQLVSYVVKMLDSQARFYVKPDRDYHEFNIEIKTRKTAFFVGYHGATIDALELVLSVMINRHFVLNRGIVLDVDGYRQRREAALIKSAKNVIREIENDHQPRPIPNLLPKERKIIHKYLTNHPYLTSVSKGRGKERTLYIAPKSFSGSSFGPDGNDDG